MSAQADRKREVWTAVCCLVRAERGRVRKWTIDPVPSLCNRHFNWLRWILNVRLTIVPLALSVRSFCFIFLYCVCKLFLTLRSLFFSHIQLQNVPDIIVSQSLFKLASVSMNLMWIKTQVIVWVLDLEVWLDSEQWLWKSCPIAATVPFWLDLPL